ETLDRPGDLLLGRLAETRELAETLGLDGGFEIVQVFDAQLRPDQLEGLGAETRDACQLDESGRVDLPELLELLHLPGRDELQDLVGGGAADALEGGQLGFGGL